MEAMERAGMERKMGCNFPWKTRTKALAARVEISNGYQAPKEIILDLRTPMEKSWMAQQECLNWFYSAERDMRQWFRGGTEFVSAEEYDESMKSYLQKAAEALERI
jgi:hypothetical protein